MGMEDDFGELSCVWSATVSESGGVKKKREQQTDREWLKVFETLPAQMLNAYGQSSFLKKTDAEVWEGLVEPLPTGAMYGTELASSSVERRGVGLNRAFHALVEYCSLQNSEEARKANEYCLKETDCC